MNAFDRNTDLKSIRWNSIESPSILTLHRNAVTQGALDEMRRDVRVHSGMIFNSSSSVEERIPLCYMRFAKFQHIGGDSSSLSNVGTAQRFYQIAEEKLVQLGSGMLGEDNFDKGAVNTAQSVLVALKEADMPAPAISWHGGDAVVMLWALGESTYAITVTDGEVGYVVRRNRKALRSEHSIDVLRFDVRQIGHNGG